MRNEHTLPSSYDGGTTSGTSTFMWPACGCVVIGPATGSGDGALGAVGSWNVGSCKGMVPMTIPFKIFNLVPLHGTFN